MRAQEKVGFHKKYHGGNRNFSKIALYTRFLVYVSVPAETNHDLGASRSSLGPHLVLVTGSARCLAARRPSSRRRLLVSRRSERLAGRGGRKPQQTRHGAWRSHGSPARKGALRPTPLARRGAAPQCPAHCGAHCRSPTTPSHCPNSSTCSHSPSPLMCPLPDPSASSYCPIPLSHYSVTIHRLTPTPTTQWSCSAHCCARTAQSHCFRTSRPALLQLRSRPAAPSTRPSPTLQHPLPQSLSPPSGCLRYYCFFPTSPPHPTCSDQCCQWGMMPPAPTTSVRVNLNSRNTHRALRPRPSSKTLDSSVMRPCS